MSDEPTERDVEDLALVVGGSNPRTGHVYIDGNDGCKAAARAVLASDWYAERIAQARREAWDEGYRQGVADERMSQETTAGEIPPGRVNPHRAALRGDA